MALSAVEASSATLKASPTLQRVAGIEDATARAAACADPATVWAVEVERKVIRILVGSVD